MNLLAEGVAVSCVPADGGKWRLVGETPDGKRLDRFRLKTVAFGWHARSFYGAAVEEGDAGLLLTPLQALDFLAGSYSLAHIAFRFDEKTEPFRAAARLMAEVLAAGMFMPMPDASGRRPVRWVMRPTGTVAEAFEGLAVSRPVQEARLWDEWFSEAVWELIETDARVARAWRRLCEEAPLLARLGEPDGRAEAGAEECASDIALPRFYEDEWLAAIGWRKDEAPFRPALQLIEPETPDGGWTLRIVLQDKTDPSRIAPLEGAELSPRRFVPPLEWGWPPDWRRLAKVKAEPFARGCIEYLAARGRVDAAGTWPVVLDEAEAWVFLTEDSMKLAQYGYPVLLPPWWEEARKAQLRLRAQVRSAPGSRLRYFTMDRVLAFDWKLAVGEVEWSEAEFLRLVEENRRLIRNGGRWVALDPATVSAIVRQMRRFAKQRGMPLRDAFALYFGGGEEIAVTAAEETGGSSAAGEAASAVVERGADHLRAIRLEIELDDMLAGMVAGLETAQSVPRIGKPAGFCGELRDYQLDGVSWLLFLRRFGLGGCLADDMGLGKTVQWIAYLLHVRENEPEVGPSLLVCPTSVVGNWQKELERFAPTLRVHVHHGPRRPKGESFAAAAANADVVLTTYALVHLDRDELASVEWDSVCLDEAQNIKNAYTKQSEAARSLSARHRVALTGTPMENRPAELWALFDFLNPGYLGSLREFERTFGRAAQAATDPVSPEEAEAAREALDRLQRLVRPFLLRRTKKDPAIRLSLPDKFETKTYVALTAEQAVLYEAIVRDMLEAAEKTTGMARRGAILAALTRLKQVCNHPATVRGLEIKTAAEASETARNRAFRGREEAEAFAERSNKLVRLVELVREARAEGDKCLIFTQYVDMGRWLQAVLPHLIGEEAPFLHGGVPKAERDRLVAAFQSGEPGAPGVFVLSLRAGGTGLNLTAASQVFHYDRWWNPAVEEQASDRAYRIGQTKDVQVHRLIALGTIEERIDDMMERKIDLVRNIVGGEQWVTELSVAELRELFALRRRWADEA